MIGRFVRSGAGSSAGPHVVFALGLALLVAQASGFIHFAFVQHVTCPEHGELVHRADAGRPGSGESAALYGASGSSGDPHEHCVDSWIRRELATPGERGRAVQLPPPSGSAAKPGLAGPAGPRFALFLLAPKNSPPA